MAIDTLIACLQSIRPPADVEEWLRIEGKPADVEVDETYSRAVRDLLTALGAVSEQTGEVTSPMAYYFIQSLIWSSREGALNSSTWKGLRGEGCSGMGLQLVDLLEANRLRCCPNPTPLRVVQAVMGIIKAQRGSEDVYLMQYDQKAEQFQPLGGKRESFDASSEAALTRELCEELLIEKLTPGKDFSLQPIVEHVQLKEVSASVHVVTAYDHSFYLLQDVRFPLATDHATRWISAAELAARRTKDGIAVSALIDDFKPGVLATLSYSLPGTVS